MTLLLSILGTLFLRLESMDAPNMAPKRRVQTLLVEVRIVKLATLVYSRQAVTK
jgi:hypothetical protein